MSARKATGIWDRHGNMIKIGDTVKVHCGCNPELHGKFVYYHIVERHGFPCVLYLKSEKETKLPMGFECGLLTHFVDEKLLVFGEDKIPICAESVEIVNSGKEK